MRTACVAGVSVLATSMVGAAMPLLLGSDTRVHWLLICPVASSSGTGAVAVACAHATGHSMALSNMAGSECVGTAVIVGRSLLKIA